MARGGAGAAGLARRILILRVREGLLRLRRLPPAEREARAARSLGPRLCASRGVRGRVAAVLASRPDLASEPYRSALAGLPGPPPAPLRRVKRALERSLGPIERRLSWIDPEPLETTAVVQVHRARLRDGGWVQLRVVHDGLTAAGLRADVRRVRREVRWMSPWIHARRAAGLVDGIARELEEELDLEAEGRKTEEVATSLRSLFSVVVPRVLWEATSPRVLALEDVPAVRLDDGAALEALGVRPADCARILAAAWGRLLVGEGRYRTDPTRPRIAVVDERSPRAPAGAGPRVLLLDLGLRRRLPLDTRRHLTRAAAALRAQEASGLLEALRALGAVVPGGERRAAREVARLLEAGAARILGETPTLASLRDLARKLQGQLGLSLRMPPSLEDYARTLAAVVRDLEEIAPDRDPLPDLLRELPG